LFCSVSLQMLVSLHSKLSRATGSDEIATLISLEDQQSIRVLLEFLVVLGLQPCLQPGVGLPLAERVSRQVQATDIVQQLHSPDNFIVFLRVLVRCSEISSLRELIFEKAFSDVLALLLQTLHTEASNPNNSNELSTLLEKTLSYAPTAMILETFLMLSGRRAQVVPPWLRRECFTGITRCLLRPSGVLALFAVLLRSALLLEDASDSKSNTVALWQQCERVATMLASCIAPAEVTVEAYYGQVCPQGSRFAIIMQSIYIFIYLYL
jgi:hypothetical protein